LLLGKTFCVLVVIFLSLLSSGLPAFATELSSSDRQAGFRAFQAAKNGDWGQARSISRQIQDPLLQKILIWSDISRTSSEATFNKIADFVENNPDWPRQRRLRRLAEEALNPETHPKRVVSWFARFEPVTTVGRFRYGEALLALGLTEKGQGEIRKAWVEGKFSKAEEQKFLAQFGKFLTPKTHVERLDNLLWAGEHQQALRMMPRVESNYRALAIARMQLRQMTSNVDASVASVPKVLQDDPGLVYERLRWLRHKDQDLSARALLAAYPLDHAKPKLWWRERSILARRALAEGHYSEAYRISSDHTLTQGVEYADAEWLAGWISLRFLDEPNLALSHFERMYNSVKYSISRARGAYWAARAAQAVGRQDLSTQWLHAAAHYPTAFYGQLAIAQIEPGKDLQLPPDPKPSAAEVSDFHSNELVRAVRVLATLNQTNAERSFLYQLGDLRNTTGWNALVASLASAHGHLDLAIANSKKAIHIGHPLIKHGYPRISVPNVGHPLPYKVETPLVLAIVRQESAFRAGAVSSAGARGLMQLLPSTAEQVAKSLKISYSRESLTGDPNYNLRLGQAYFSKLLNDFNGSYVLALAAYNAGPHRVKQWMRANGLPGESVPQSIDWIELIPFGETRNYVQRILENLQIYRRTLNQTELTLALERDLSR
jgi:soluble lytic murein transglycosylase